MSKNDMTIGEEFEDFLSFTMNYNPKKKLGLIKKKKEKTYYRPSEVRDIYRQNNMTDKMMYERLVALGVCDEEAKMVVQKILHPTIQDLELEKTIRKEDLYLD